jgi:hypothetical protein
MIGGSVSHWLITAAVEDRVGLGRILFDPPSDDAGEQLQRPCLFSTSRSMCRAPGSCVSSVWLVINTAQASVSGSERGGTVIRLGGAAAVDLR